MTVPVPSMELFNRLVQGDLRAAGRLMSRAEAGSEEARAALGEVYKAAGKAHIIGLTGVPGSGKSTLVSKLVQTMREDGRKVGVIAIAEDAVQLKRGTFKVAGGSGAG